MPIRNTVEFVVQGGEVKRFHTINTIGTDTNGHHSFLVSMICSLLDPECSKQLLLAALTHDLAEQKVGDVPSPTKTRMGLDILSEEERILRDHSLEYQVSLSEKESRTLKLADFLAGLVFCRREIAMGNSLILPCHTNYKDLVLSMQPFNELEEKVANAIIHL